MQLYFYNDTFQQAVDEYQITEDQLRFTGSPKECTELSLNNPDRFAILAVENGNLIYREMMMDLCLYRVIRYNLYKRYKCEVLYGIK